MIKQSFKIRTITLLGLLALVSNAPSSYCVKGKDAVVPEEDGDTFEWAQYKYFQCNEQYAQARYNLLNTLIKILSSLPEQELTNISWEHPTLVQAKPLLQKTSSLEQLVGPGIAVSSSVLPAHLQPLAYSITCLKQQTVITLQALENEKPALSAAISKLNKK